MFDPVAIKSPKSPESENLQLDHQTFTGLGVPLWQHNASGRSTAERHGTPTPAGCHSETNTQGQVKSSRK